MTWRTATEEQPQQQEYQLMGQKLPCVRATYSFVLVSFEAAILSYLFRFHFICQRAQFAPRFKFN